MSVDGFNSLVRSGVTLALTGAQITLAGAWAQGADGAEQAFAGLTPFTMMAVTFWFKSRDERPAGGSA